MRHLTVAEFGSFLGITGSRLVVRSSDGHSWETALSRLRTIRVAKEGVSLSSNLLHACAARGIRIYFTDWRDIGVVAVSGLHQHAVVNVRRHQFACIETPVAREIAREIVLTKIRNQRAVLLYFGKYQNKAHVNIASVIPIAAEVLAKAADNVKTLTLSGERWRDRLGVGCKIRTC